MEVIFVVSIYLFRLKFLEDFFAVLDKLEDKEIVVAGLFGFIPKLFKLLEGLLILFFEGDIHVEVQDIKRVFKFINFIVEERQLFDGPGIFFLK